MCTLWCYILYSNNSAGSVPGKQAFVESFVIHLWVRHDSSIEIKVVQPVEPVQKKKISQS